MKCYQYHLLTSFKMPSLKKIFCFLSLHEVLLPVSLHIIFKMLSCWRWQAAQALPFWFNFCHGSRVCEIRQWSDMAQFGQILLRTDTRLVFCNRKLLRTDIIFTRIIEPICNFVNPVEDRIIFLKLCWIHDIWNFALMAHYFI
jgi:hypothetical protein